MDPAPPPKPAFAWEPLTARGVAAFASASFGRLWAVQLIFALLASATVMFVLYQTWFPTIRTAILAMPNPGEVRSGKLNWFGPTPDKLAENRFLSLAVDLEHSGAIRTPAHVQVEFGAAEVKVISLLGSVTKPYPRRHIIAFNRHDLEPWFGAWAPALLAISGAAVIVVLFVSWSALATVYFLPAWLLGFFANRDIGAGKAWRLCGAALMPGCLLLVAALFFYSLSLLDVVHLLVFGGLHLVLGWVYVVWGVIRLPRHPAALDPKSNPFMPKST